MNSPGSLRSGLFLLIDWWILNMIDMEKAERMLLFKESEMEYIVGKIFVCVCVCVCVCEFNIASSVYDY